MNFNNFTGIEWQSKSHGKPGGKYWLIVSIFLFLLIAATCLTMWACKTSGYWPFIVYLVFVFILASYLLIYSKTSRWYNSVMIFAVSKQEVMFSRKLNNTYFSETFDNVSGYACRDEGNNLTSVIICFKTPAPAGTMGKLKEMRMIKIENFDKLREILENNNIPQQSYPSK